MYCIEKYTEVNIQGTAIMLDILANEEHEIKKIVIASSRSIYGEGKYIHPEFGAVYPNHRNEEDMLAGKLCKCIKKVQSRRQIPEKAAIGLCRESIFKNRGIDFYKFKCKKGQKLLPMKGTKKVLKKFSKKIGFNTTKKSKKNK